MRYNKSNQRSALNYIHEASRRTVMRDRVERESELKKKQKAMNARAKDRERNGERDGERDGRI